MFCPANERYNRKVAIAGSIAGFTCYQMVEGSPGGNNDYCSLPWRPFGYNGAAGPGTEAQPKKMSAVAQVKSPSQIWAMVDADRLANAGMGNSGTLPDTPAHGNSRNYLWFDWHVAPFKAANNGDKKGLEAVQQIKASTDKRHAKGKNPSLTELDGQPIFQLVSERRKLP